MSQLPYDEKLNIGQLSKLFEETTNCYKFFWFKAILKLLSENKTRFSYNEILNEMIIDAWYMVTEYHLHLGPVGKTDNLEEVVKYIGATKHFPSSVKDEVITAYLENNDDRQIRAYKNELIKNVPYRIHYPFLEEKAFSNREWYRPREIALKLNQKKHLLYYYEAYQQLATRICINDSWIPYLLTNKEILLGWMRLQLIYYLQKRNPSIPGIADKLDIPEERDVKRVRKFWKLIIELRPDIRDIYGNIELADEKISVDHFVPWQYVAHDELWNLHPTTKSINSSKSNGLPDWETYFEPFSRLEYLSYTLSKDNPIVKETFANISQYHLNNEEITKTLYCDGLNEQDFRNRLRNVIQPVYNAAQNNGFKRWKYNQG